uniref:Temptin Cys/Cys disulfide domain-containing protein n=3 Tax=Magallana gigas TaxID=29159 RepID=A0A8W8J1C0_MAGGI|nr:temptin-like [Crassostrea gigas]XP_034331125.1 temptin-like [Crassostrea gigas]
MLKIAVLVCVCVGLMHGYPGFLKEIPNGEAVPNPCTEDPEDKWNLVGHMYASRIEFMRARRQNPDRYVNVFGEMFFSNGQNWTAICDLDADNDGKTNGVELGDPECVWERGTIPAGPATGHPGICEIETQECLSKASDICPTTTTP